MRISVTPARTLGAIDDRIFGGFIENLGRCIYGGVYDPGSPVADSDGFREDVIDGARAMGVSTVRFPGGCYAPYYHWTDGVGDRAARPQTLYRADLAWPASNDFGTNEYLAWCAKVGAEPYICVNMGSGTPEEARNWVEYCNGAPGSRWADLRVAHGHPEPWGVTLWALGNEISAPWEFGYTDTPEKYISRARDFAHAMKAADPSIELVASGAHFPIDFQHRNWNRNVLDRLHDVTDYVSIHHYIGHDYKDEIVDQWEELGTTEVHYRLTEWMRLLDDALGIMAADIRLINHEKNSRKPIGIALDEYNPWYKGDGSKDLEVFPLSDGLLVAAYFNMFLRRADTVRLCNMAQLVNTIPAIVVESGGSRSYRQSTSYIQELFLANRGQTAVDAWADSPRRRGRYFEDFPLVDVSASVSADRTRITVNVTNRSDDTELPVELDVVGATAGPWTARRLGGVDLATVNDFDQPERLHILEDADVTVLPPGSHTVFTAAMAP